MRPTDLPRAELYARSVLFAQRVGNARLAATFADRGRAVAGGQWDAILARAADPQPAAEAATPAPKGKARKAKA